MEELVLKLKKKLLKFLIWKKLSLRILIMMLLFWRRTWSGFH